MADEFVVPRPSATDYRWQTQPSKGAHTPDKHARRRRNLIFLAGLILAILALVIVWLRHLKPPPPLPFFLTINISEYNNRQYPIIPFATRDGDLLARHFSKKKQAVTQTKELLRKELMGLASRTEPLIVEIRSLAFWRAGKILLLPGDANPADESTWLDVVEVLEAVENCAAKHKLLILDIVHPLADPRLGIFKDRVAETLDDVINHKQPTFYVLCPCSAGQCALTSEVLQGSVLTYYLDQGLQGHADTQKDLRITVKDLFAFVEARVDRWAQQNRALRQKPRLLGNGTDFVIAWVTRNSPENIKLPDLEPYAERLQKGWKSLDQSWDKQAYRQAPRLMRKLEVNLLRQEALTRGAAVLKSDLGGLDDELERINKELLTAATIRHVPPRSLALALSQAGIKESSEFVDSVLDILCRAKDASAKKDINAKVEEELFKKLQEPKGIDFPQQAWAVVEALNRTPRLSADHLRVGNDVLWKLTPWVQHVEILNLQRLIAFASRNDVDGWHAEKMTTILQTVQAREKLIARLDQEPRLLPWLAANFEDADELRHTGEEKLLWRGMSTWMDGLEKMQSAKAKYEEGLRGFEILYRGRSQLDRAFAELPAYMKLICDWPEFDAQAERLWHKAVEAADRVQSLLSVPPAPSAAAAKAIAEAFRLDADGREIERHLQDLAKLLGKRVNLSQKEDTAESLDQILCLLDTPLVKAPDRAALMARQRKLAAKLHAATETLDRDDNQVGRRIIALPALPRWDRDSLGFTRARMSLAILQLRKFDFEGKKLAIPATESNLNSPEWADLEKRFQACWAKNLVNQWQNAQPSFSADALNRTVSPWVLRHQPGAIEMDASWIMQKQMRDAFVRWLQQRYQSEIRFAADNPDDKLASIFFTEALQELRLRGVESD